MVLAKRTLFATALAAASLLAACQPSGVLPSPSGPPSNSSAGADLRAASAGLCQTIAELPDAAAAERAFDNSSHEALHALAAAPGLEREMSAKVLESMERVEADFAGSAKSDVLAADLQALATRTDDALRSLGLDIPPCG